jgi:redox-sensitive bicupin YhaK (pirin superfamily)
MSGIRTATNTALVERGIARVVTTPPPAPGFIGEGHTAVPVLDPRDFARNDPFIVLMDDRIDLAPGRKAGGAHPHAGFEIATFVVEGELRDRDEGLLRAGDVAWTTAGSGIVHNEDVEPLGKSRILQLWMTLPTEHRWAEPRFEHVPLDAVPLRREAGADARVYSGTSGSTRAAPHTQLPMTMVDIRLEPGAALAQELPGSYNGFLYVLEGDLVAGGPEATRLTKGQVGWLGDAHAASQTMARLAAGESGARAVLYAGERQGVGIVMHGPFVGETRADLVRLSQAFVQGQMPRVSELRTTARG